MNFTLKVLGTASAKPTTDRYQSAQVLDIRGRLFLIDCGEGVQMRLAEAHVSVLNINHICISHMHGDHVFGIFGLLSTMGMFGRSAALDIFAPPAFAPLLDFFIANFGQRLGFEINFVPLKAKAPEVVFETKSVELLAFPLRHGIETYGFIIREKEPDYNVRKESISKYGLTISEIASLKKGRDVVRMPGDSTVASVENGFRPCSGSSEPLTISLDEAAYKPYAPRSYAYCSDTAPFPELAEWVHGVTLLYHEATFPKDMAERAEATCHSRTVDAAKCASDAAVGQLIVGHFSSRYKKVDFFLEEIREIFPNAILCNDGDVFELPLIRMPF